MTKPVPPVTAASVQRRAGRRETDPALAREVEEKASPSGTNLPVVSGPLSHRDDSPASAVEAQILGQDGVKRGLRGGKPVLDQARSAYLGTEYSGAADRRPKSGLVAQTKL